MTALAGTYTGLGWQWATLSRGSLLHLVPGRLGMSRTACGRQIRPSVQAVLLTNFEPPDFCGWCMKKNGQTVG